MQREKTNFVKILETLQENFQYDYSEISLLCPLVRHDSALKDQILSEDMHERKTFIFGENESFFGPGFERENESIVGPGIISIPLLSSKSGLTVMATCYVCKDECLISIRRVSRYSNLNP